jgi:hypothetical protein
VRTLIDPAAPEPEWTGMLGFEAHGIDPAQVPSIGIEPGTTCFAFGKRAYYLYYRDADGKITFGSNLPWTDHLTISQARAIPAQQWVSTLRETYAGDVPGEEMTRALTPQNLSPVGALHIMPLGCVRCWRCAGWPSASRPSRSPGPGTKGGRGSRSRTGWG